MALLSKPADLLLELLYLSVLLLKMLLDLRHLQFDLHVLLRALLRQFQNVVEVSLVLVLLLDQQLLYLVLVVAGELLNLLDNLLLELLLLQLRRADKAGHLVRELLLLCVVPRELRLYRHVQRVPSDDVLRIVAYRLEQPLLLRLCLLQRLYQKLVAERGLDDVLQLLVFGLHLTYFQHNVLRLRPLVVYHLQQVLLDLLHVPLVLQLALAQRLLQLLVRLDEALYLVLELRDHLDRVLRPGRLHDQVVLVRGKLYLRCVHLRDRRPSGLVPGKLRGSSRLLGHLPEILPQVLAELLHVWPPRLDSAKELVRLLRYRRRDLIPHLVWGIIV